MAPINQPADLLSQVQQLRRDLDQLRRDSGLSSATINRGGLTLLNDAFLKMVSSLGHQIVYLGPGSDGKQIIQVRRADGSLVLYTYTHEPTGNQYWALTDKTGRILVSDDAASGVGLARPWLHVPMQPMWAATGTWAYRTIDAATIAAETTLWEGRIGLVSHPYIEVYGLWGQASGSNSATYRFYVGGTLVQTWAPPFQAAVYSGSIAALIDQPWVRVHLTAQATGTGQVAAGLQGVWLKQSP